MSTSLAVHTCNLSHSYGQRLAIDNLNLEVSQGEWFAFLGPNGSGKTTLFRILSTLIQPQSGEVSAFGRDIVRNVSDVRARIGVVFQSPSLDKKLTVVENLRHQAALYGIRGKLLADREAALLDQFGLAERRNDRTEQLSGGMRRRLEIAKGLIHRPSLLLLDEPSTGLDPGARADLWSLLRTLRQETNVTIAMTTHLLDEADKVDRIAILNHGKLVGLGTPNELRSTVGGDSINIETRDAIALAKRITEKFSVPASAIENTVRMELPDGHQWIPRLVEAFTDQILSISLAKPTLEDVFIAKTGHRFFVSKTEAAK